jgi:methionyl-tRNA formyltransferase
MEATAMERLKLVFVTPEEPSVMPLFFEKVILEIRDEIAAVAVVSPIYKKSSWLRQANKFVDSFGLREFGAEAAHYGYYKGADALRKVVPIGDYHSVKGIARSHGLHLLTPEDVNAPDFLEELRRVDPDLVISVSCPQIFREELLELPRLGCVNVHSALLPHYRGVLPTFWALAKGERETGVTVHYMSPGIDGGDIILQERIAISDEETLHSLMRKCKSAAADLILETVRRFRAGSVPVSPNDPDGGSYYSFPKREDVREFKALGRRLR